MPGRPPQQGFDSFPKLRVRRALEDHHRGTALIPGERSPGRHGAGSIDVDETGLAKRGVEVDLPFRRQKAVVGDDAQHPGLRAESPHELVEDLESLEGLAAPGTRRVLHGIEAGKVSGEKGRVIFFRGRTR